jgi:hypothetical protein
MKSRLAGLLDQVLLLSDVNQRKVGCLVGAGVADAAARPLHWVYDLGDLDAAIASSPDTPEFLPQSASPFYSLPTGETSCYFDEAFAVMTSLKNTRQFDFKDICDEFEKQLGPNSPYDMKRREEYMELRRYGKVQGPIVGKWLHGSMIKFFENRKSSQSSADMFGDPHVKETDGFCCALPVVVKYAGEEGLMEKVLKVATTQSTWPVAFKHALVASKIIEGFVEGVPDPIAGVREGIKGEFPEIYKELNTVDSLLSTPHTEAVGYVFGRPCYNPGSFLGAIHAVRSSESFEEAVRKTIKAGGCNCSRSFFIGAMLGARDGVSGIPRDWLEKTTHVEQILETAIDMVKE